MAGGADLREEAVRLAELSLAPLLVAALVRQLGELDVDQRLVRLRSRVSRASSSARASAASISSRAAGPAEPSRTRASARFAMHLTWTGRDCAAIASALSDQGARPLRIAEAEV